MEKPASALCKPCCSVVETSTGSSLKGSPSGTSEKAKDLFYVAVRILLLPIPAIPTHIFDRVHRAPFEMRFAADTSAHASRCLHCDGLGPQRERRLRSLPKSLDQLQHRRASAGTQIEGMKTANIVFRRPVNRLDVPSGQVRNVDVVAHTAAIDGWIIRPKTGNTGKLPIAARVMYGKDYWESPGADLRFVRCHGSNRIEIPQGDAGEIRVGFTMISQYLLHHRLGLAIRIRRSDCVLPYRANLKPDDIPLPRN